MCLPDFPRIYGTPWYGFLLHHIDMLSFTEKNLSSTNQPSKPILQSQITYLITIEYSNNNNNKKIF